MDYADGEGAMECAQLQEDLCVYVDNELEPDDRARVEAHVSACEACAGELSTYRSIKSLVSRVKRQRQDVPDSIRALPDVREAPTPATRLSWFRRPVAARSVMLAAAAVFVCLLLSWRSYEGRFIRSAQHREAVQAHLSGLVSALPREPAARNISTPRKPISQVGDELYAVRSGPARIGHRYAFQTVYFVDRNTVSQLRFEAGEFDDRSFEKQTIGGREYRVGCCGDYSIASYRRGSVQIVLVSDATPEALLLLAQNIPADTPFNPTGY